jgi:hypothetical protein
MIKYVLVIASLCSSVSSAAMAQHSGTPEEQRACASNVQRFCRPVIDQGDFAVLACLQQHREKLTGSCKKVLTDHGQ